MKDIKAPKAKRSLHIREFVIWMAVKLAFLCLIVLAAFGMRELLNALNETTSLTITILAVGFLTYIIFEHDSRSYDSHSTIEQ